MDSSSNAPQPKPTFEQLYTAELHNLVNLATFFLSSRQEAEEAVQDTFVKLHKRWHKIDNPKPFVKRAVVNRCKDLLKQRKRYAKRVEQLQNQPRTTPERHYLLDILDKLDDQRRLIVVLRFYGNYQLNEIANLLDLPEGTVRSNLYRGLQELERMLEQ